MRSSRTIPTSSPGGRPGVSYFYDCPLPSRLAASIQILNTCRKLAGLGAPSTVFAGPVRSADCYRFYGIEPDEHFRLEPLFSRIPLQPDLQWKLRRVVRNPGSAVPNVLMSRGETGVDILPRIRQLRPSSPMLLVYEAHRLGFAREAERQSGRRWQPGDALSAEAERVRAREQKTIESVDAIVALTSGVKSALVAAFQPACPVLVLPSGVSLPDVRDGPDASSRARDIDVIYAGKLERRKGLEVLLEAMRYMPARQLWILGGTDAQVQEHRQLADRIGVARRITFTGFVEPARVAGYLRRARAGVCPLATGASVISEEFTSPLKLLELMAHNVPVVATDLPTIRAIVEPGVSAILVPPDDPRALADGIASVLEDAAMAERLCAAAARRAEDFSWEARARRLLEFLETLPLPAS